MVRLLKALVLGLVAGSAHALDYTEPYRPQYHFSPRKNWMNDPSGLLYHNGIYHLFFQYNPASNEWGNMSWGHATSKDLTHWDEQPIALRARGYPQNVTEMYFTGSAVVDVNNTSGFGRDGKIPLVAMYTSYYPPAQKLPSGKQVRTEQQSQSIAYSLDDGVTWTTYDVGNPVIQSPPAPYGNQYKNFRDPYVFWHDKSHKWVVITALAEIHKLLIFTSDDLKDWSLASEFGPYNAVGGVWECPNIFPLALDGNQSALKWVLVLGLNPGGPPGTVGSGTQYFVGEFNGTTFTADPDSLFAKNTTSNWMDWGPDFYAAAAYQGLSIDKHVQVGWMNNWQYGQKIPTSPWRSAMAIPRRLSLKTIGQKATLLQQPQEDWGSIMSRNGVSRSWKSIPEGTVNLGTPGETFEVQLNFSDRNAAASKPAEFAIAVRATNSTTQQTRIGYDFAQKRIFVDRTKSGNVTFDSTFASVYHAPFTPSAGGNVSLHIFVDRSSVEVFGGQGEATLTAQIFPGKNAINARLQSTGGTTENVSLKMASISSVWTK
ncbi:hypothetical protein NUU61_002357 [Penicillium alfredii]|uniref:fructan beta-fructosidase n=1 Tax=Penicillium alfredii TaxID=1506179 RepID=A0A9W9FRE2_9EURO|nr:uncharacterized protein NUU61_002357 [Penicillium alfredii]KAJ5105010.1 hypothetical protein NUU61_002357 [Penicillium alfredii]